jgi:hypothetical protein
VSPKSFFPKVGEQLKSDLLLTDRQKNVSQKFNHTFFARLNHNITKNVFKSESTQNITNKETGKDILYTKKNNIFF